MAGPLCNIIMQKFETEIVDSKGYQKTRWRAHIFSSLFFVVFIILGLKYRAELFELHYLVVIVLLAIGLVSVIIATDSAFGLDKFKKLGQLIFDNETLTIKTRQNKMIVLKVKELKNIQFTLYNPKNKVKWVRQMKNDGANNWISFERNDKKVNIELFLRSEKDDELFLEAYENWKLVNPSTELIKSESSFLNQLSKIDKDYLVDRVFEKIT